MNVAQEAMEISSQQDLERKMSGLRNDMQVWIIFHHAIMLCFEDDRDHSSSFLFLWLFTFGI